MANTITSSLTLTKLQRPRVGRGLVARPRLLERLDASESLTLVLAPAGYGKTTLLSTWLETCDLPYAWLSLDEYDNDPVVFATYLLVALHTLFPAVAAETLSVMGGVSAPPPATIARRLLNDLVDVEQNFILVLDDYQVIHSQAIHDLLTEIVRHPPRTLHLVIASRPDPPLPLAGLRARGTVTELRGADLRFTLGEAEHFLRKTMALPIDDQIIAALTAKTEGWPAGLRLAALSLRQQRAPGMIVANALGDNRYVMDYLMAEVLAQLPISVQEFLIKTCILDQLCSPLCEAVTGMTDRMFSGQYILEWLERADLFLAPADDRQRWYRCHQLFRQLLRDRLQQLHGPAEIAALHLRASEWFAENGYLDEALHHALEAGDMNAAVQIVAQHRHEMMNQAQWQRLDRWAHLFPRAVIDAQPDLLLIEVWMSFLQQRLGEVPALLDRVEALLARLPIKVASSLQGEVESRRSALLYWRGDVAPSMMLARQALEKVPLTWWYVRGYARLFLSAGYQLSGDLTQAYATLYETGEPDQSPGYQNLLMGAACLVHWTAADLAGSAQTARQVVSNSALSDRDELIAFSHLYLGHSYYQRNDLIAAEKYLLPLVMQPYALHAACFLNSAVTLAHIRQTQGRPQEAQDIVDLVLSFAHEIRSEVILLGARAFQADLALRQGRLTEAGQWAEQYGSFRRVPMPFPFVLPVVLAKILLAHNTPTSRQQARELLSQMDDYFTLVHHPAIRIQVLALQAMLHSAEGDESQALAALSNSIALGEPSGFLRLFVDLGSALIPLLRKLAQHGVSSAYINEILAAFDSSEMSSGAERPLSTASVPPRPNSALLTNREQEVLQLLVKRYTDKEIAETLVISPKTVSSHVDHLGDKLGVRGRRAIVEAAKTQGLLA